MWLLGLLRRKCFGLIAHIGIFYVENVGLMACGRRWPEERCR
jgi:hypothetical protein